VGTRVLQGVRAVDADQQGPYSTVQYSVMPGAHSVSFTASLKASVCRNVDLNSCSLLEPKQMVVAEKKLVSDSIIPLLFTLSPENNILRSFFETVSS
jgi:hypothetical protein